MSWSQAAAARRSASSPRMGARVRAWAATPWVCAQRRGSGSARRVRASPLAQVASAMPVRLRGGGLGWVADVAALAVDGLDEAGAFEFGEGLACSAAGHVVAVH